jgi:hypothetical protein
MNVHPGHYLVRATAWTVAGVLFTLGAIGGLLSARYHAIDGIWATVVASGLAFASFKERRRILRLPRPLGSQAGESSPPASTHAPDGPSNPGAAS